MREAILLNLSLQLLFKLPCYAPVKVAIYARVGIWNEALLGNISLRQEHPKQWQEFLNSVELEHLADFSIVTIDLSKDFI